MTDKLIILDLDETLIFSSLIKLSFKEDFKIYEYFIYKRPGLERFLDFIQSNFQMAVWTSSNSDYAHSVIKHIFPDPTALNFIWTREKCISKFDAETKIHCWIKDLKKVKKLGFDLEKVLIIDDSPEKLQRSYGNHIRVIPFLGDQEDEELLILSLYLHKIKTLDAVRSIEKRYWKKNVSNI